MFIFIETRLFSRLADEYLPDDQLARLQHHLNENPEAGDIIRESGGVRKLLPEIETRRDLAAYAVCQERGGKHLRTNLEEDQGGN